jgi:hypothetical protein
LLNFAGENANKYYSQTLITMNFDDDFEFNDEDLSPEDREELEREIAEEVYRTVKALLDSIPEGHLRRMHEGTMMESAMIIPAKIAGAIGSESWLICMQNGAIIREHAHYLLICTSGLKAEENVDQQYVQLLRDEMLRFRELFVEWVKEINNMEEEDYEDEWGLFIRK